MGPKISENLVLKAEIKVCPPALNGVKYKVYANKK